MPKKLQYTSEEIVTLGDILLEKIIDIISRGNENLSICDDSFIEEITKKLSKDRKIKGKLITALKNCKGEATQWSISKAEGVILKIFNDEYAIGSDDRMRITARIRGKREKVKKPVKLTKNAIKKSTKNKLKSLRSYGEIEEGMSTDAMVNILINSYMESCEEDN